MRFLVKVKSTSKFVLPKLRYDSRRRMGCTCWGKECVQHLLSEETTTSIAVLPAPELTLPTAVSTALRKNLALSQPSSLETSEAGQKLSINDQLDCTHVRSTWHRTQFFFSKPPSFFGQGLLGPTWFNKEYL